MASATVAAVQGSAAAGSSSSAEPGYAGAIQIAVGGTSVLLDDEKSLEALTVQNEDAEAMVGALEALQARVAMLKEKMAEKAAQRKEAAAAASSSSSSSSSSSAAGGGVKR